MSEQSPFVPGARVAIHVGGSYEPTGYKEDFVLKVHKNGNFTLRSTPTQQWRPHASSVARTRPKEWQATKTGDHGWRGRDSLRIWNDENDAEIVEAIGKHDRYHKFKKLRDQLSQVKFSDLVTDEVLDQLQIVVLAIKPIK